MGQRQAAADKTRDRILAAARKLLLAKDFSEFTMEAVARAADVSRLTVYYQFNSKAGLLEALYDYIARAARWNGSPNVFRQGGDPIRMLHDFILVFARFWASDRIAMRRLHALGAIDTKSDKASAPATSADAWPTGDRRALLHVYLELTPPQLPMAIDTLHMLTSFETFDALAGKNGRAFEEVVEISAKWPITPSASSPGLSRPLDPVKKCVTGLTGLFQLRCQSTLRHSRP